MSDRQSKSGDQMLPGKTGAPPRRSLPRADRTAALVRRLSIEPVRGKTYSLFGSSDSTTAYFKRLAGAADHLLGDRSDGIVLLRRIQGWRQNRRELRRARVRKTGDDELRSILEYLRPELGEYTRDVAEHLRSLSLRTRWDRTLSMTEDQYHLAMLEIELANRVHVRRFRESTLKLAFLPHCLRDMSKECKSTPDDRDSVCMGCSARCWINGVSTLLREHNVLPYIWLQADLRALFRSIRKQGIDVAVLGIACVPELARGIALCMRHGVPVIGLPLNANRCRRWTGKFWPNSVDLAQLEMLLGRRQE